MGGGASMRIYSCSGTLEAEPAWLGGCAARRSATPTMTDPHYPPNKRARGVPNSAADLWISFEVFTAIFDMHL